ncbi:hypothetical protein Cyrtocomes_00625 [Candidatus Cyrtobacter comes]|uniref:Uncharacterized protein n=1 Tax=Candidatus Cyrtobacter comes TaxID=675776 RepID=A0ABU5L8S3_9RICK|nr:hypothetical protein [Candidatus Cyrtobacter comes]MDZ5762249.1 hypothetical protein [Candidatus Cyrtobacter comes]
MKQGVQKDNQAVADQSQGSASYETEGSLDSFVSLSPEDDTTLDDSAHNGADDNDMGSFVLAHDPTELQKEDMNRTTLLQASHKLGEILEEFGYVGYSGKRAYEALGNVTSEAEACAELARQMPGLISLLGKLIKDVASLPNEVGSINTILAKITRAVSERQKLLRQVSIAEKERDTSSRRMIAKEQECNQLAKENHRLKVQLDQQKRGGHTFIKITDGLSVSYKENGMQTDPELPVLDNTTETKTDPTTNNTAATQTDPVTNNTAKTQPAPATKYAGTQTANVNINNARLAMLLDQQNNKDKMLGVTDALNQVLRDNREFLAGLTLKLDISLGFLLAKLKSIAARPIGEYHITNQVTKYAANASYALQPLSYILPYLFSFVHKLTAPHTITTEAFDEFAKKTAINFVTGQLTAYIRQCVEIQFIKFVSNKFALAKLPTYYACYKLISSFKSSENINNSQLILGVARPLTVLASVIHAVNPELVKNQTVSYALEKVAFIANVLSTFAYNYHFCSKYFSFFKDSSRLLDITFKSIVIQCMIVSIIDLGTDSQSMRLFSKLGILDNMARLYKWSTDHVAQSLNTISETKKSLCTQVANDTSALKDDMEFLYKLSADYATQGLDIISETTKSLYTQAADYATWAKDNATYDNMVFVCKYLGTVNKGFAK